MVARLLIRPLDVGDRPEGETLRLGVEGIGKKKEAEEKAQVPLGTESMRKR
jgi:hypothetical protein